MNYYQERNYKVKKPRDLRLEIKPENTVDVETLIKGIKRRSRMFIIVLPFILLILSAGLFDAIKKSQEGDIVIRATILTILFIQYVRVIKTLVGARLDNIMGAQYGIVKRVYSEKSATSSRRERYVDVDFPEEHSSIKRIRYFWEGHFTLGKADLEEGDNVLVITFNGKKAHIIFVTNNY